VKKIAGILGLLIVICIFSSISSQYFLTGYNFENLLRRTALFGIISIGAAFVIIGRGIDLSIGSMICLTGITTPWLLSEFGWSPLLAVPVVLLISVLIGTFHGLLVTRVGLQPFIVTLCGLLLYRGIARGMTGDQSQTFGESGTSLDYLATGRIPIPGVESMSLPMPCLILLGIMLIAALVLNKTVYGRHLQAIGRNEEAARYSGINTQLVTTISYAICSLLAGIGGVLLVLDVRSAQPDSFGNFYELYAIAAAVLGGCSLRGGEGAICGVIIGTAVMQVLRNTITLTNWIPDNVEYAVIGFVILCGVIADELVRKAIAKRGVKTV
jgi:ribose transport system permease protein